MKLVSWYKQGGAINSEGVSAVVPVVTQFFWGHHFWCNCSAVALPLFWSRTKELVLFYINSHIATCLYNCIIVHFESYVLYTARSRQPGFYALMLVRKGLWEENQGGNFPCRQMNPTLWEPSYSSKEFFLSSKACWVTSCAYVQSQARLRLPDLCLETTTVV